jgi:enoyl-CoA hydratase/carnithine racemase
MSAEGTRKRWPEYDTLRLAEPSAGVLLATLGRPDQLNAINTELATELLDLFERRLPVSDDIRVVVVTGAGDKAFCVGADLKERYGMSDADWRVQHALYRRTFDAIARYPFPILAAVNGYALGGGAELALTADICYAVARAEFGFPEVKLGIMPGVGGTQRLPRLIGESRAMELILTGARIDAAQAMTWGMINRVVDDDLLLDNVLETAARIAENAPLACQGIKRSIHYGLQAGLDAGMQLEVSIHQRLAVSRDRQEGIAAFNEKRPPRWTGS